MAGKDTFIYEKENKKKGFITSLITHIFLLIILIIPLLSKPEIIDLGGILIAFGDPEVGFDSEPAEDIENSKTKVLSPNPPPLKSTSDNVSSETKDETSIIKASEKKNGNPNTIDPKILEKKRAEEDKLKEEADRIARESAEKAKAEKEATDLANQKKKYSDLIGKGQGNNNTAGNQGTEKGNPDGKALEGISKGSGRIGGGLSGRGVEYEPSFSDSSQKTGKVTLSICVNIEGKVSKADFTQKGSTTSDPYLVDLAKKTALKYRFSKSEIESQCGTVTIDYKVR